MSIYKLGGGGSSPTPQPETVTIGGTTYPVIKVGTQKWLGANLDYRFTGVNFNPENWADGNPNCCYYGGGNTPYKTGYGLLYNFAAVQLIESNNIIPGWHVPTLDEMLDLINYIGGPESADKLKTSEEWYLSRGTNDYNFSALPAGMRDYDGLFYYDTRLTYIWTSNAINSDSADTLHIRYNEDVFINSDNKLNGCSIRMIRD